MFDKNILVLSLGVAIGVIVSLYINSSNQVDYDKLVSMISKSVVSNIEANYKQPSTPYLSSNTVEQKEMYNVKASDPDNKVMLIELKKLIVSISNERHNKIENSVKSIPVYRNEFNLIGDKLTVEQKSREMIVVLQAEDYLDEVIGSGVWKSSNVDDLREITSSLSAEENVKIQQQILAAMNDGRIKTDLGPMELF